MSLVKKDVEAFLSAKAGRLRCSVCGGRDWETPTDTTGDEYLTVRCCRCGHVVLFDIGFVEESLPKIVEPPNPAEEAGNGGCPAANDGPKQGLWHKFLGLFG